MLVVKGKNPKAFSLCHLESLVDELQNFNSKYPVQMPLNTILLELTDWHLDTIYKKQVFGFSFQIQSEFLFL